jgi:hypothetical protein
VIKGMVIVANTLIGLFFITFGTVNAEEKYSKYEKQDYWFSIMYPTTWKIEETKLGYKFTVKFLSDYGNIVVAVKEPVDATKKTIGFIKDANLSELQLKDFGHMIYDKVPGVLDVKVFITTLSNERALGSVYFYEVNTLGASLGYMRILKLETLRSDKFYKLEVSTKLYDSPQMANKAFDQIWPIFELVIKSFVFCSMLVKSRLPWITARMNTRLFWLRYIIR